MALDRGSPIHGIIIKEGVSMPTGRDFENLLFSLPFNGNTGVKLRRGQGDLN